MNTNLSPNTAIDACLLLPMNNNKIKLEGLSFLNVEKNKEARDGWYKEFLKKVSPCKNNNDQLSLIYTPLTCPWNVMMKMVEDRLHTTTCSEFLGKTWTEFTAASPPWFLHPTKVRMGIEDEENFNKNHKYTRKNKECRVKSKEERMITRDMSKYE